MTDKPEVTQADKRVAATILGIIGTPIPVTLLDTIEAVVAAHRIAHQPKPEYGRIHTDGSRSGGQPPLTPGAEMEMSLGFDPDRKPKPPSADLVGVVRKLIAQLGTVQFERDELRDQLAAAIERHEAFTQEVGDAVEAYLHADYRRNLGPEVEQITRFIIAKPDPLVEALNECGFGVSINAADDIRKALAARGLKIVEVE
jgi:hypothetical protein